MNYREIGVAPALDARIAEALHSRLLKEGSYLGFVRLPVASIVFLRAPGHVRAVSELTGFLCVTRKTQDT